MNAEAASALERRIAALLGAGTWLASLVIAGGLAIPAATALVKAGVALFIALPIARVALMLVAFLRHRDYRIGIVSVLVLLIILLGIVFGARTSGQGGLALGSALRTPVLARSLGPKPCAWNAVRSGQEWARAQRVRPRAKCLSPSRALRARLHGSAWRRCALTPMPHACPRAHVQRTHPELDHRLFQLGPFTPPRE